MACWPLHPGQHRQPVALLSHRLSGSQRQPLLLALSEVVLTDVLGAQPQQQVR
jgi:hypothetical protein